MKSLKFNILILVFATALFSIQSCSDCGCDKCDDEDQKTEENCEKSGCGEMEDAENSDCTRTEMSITKVA